MIIAYCYAMTINPVGVIWYRPFSRWALNYSKRISSVSFRGIVNNIILITGSFLKIVILAIL